MISTKITIQHYLAEYCIAKFNNGDSVTPVRFPDELDLYHIIWSLMMKRPDNVPVVDNGNIEIALPNRKIGKDPQYYNYISSRGAAIIQRTIRSLFYSELRRALDDNREGGRFYQDQEVIYMFMTKYNIESISADALQKNYLRWRNSINQNRRRRKYARSMQKNDFFLSDQVR